MEYSKTASSDKERPARISVEVDGQTYSLKWQESKQRYRLNLVQDGKRRDAYFGPDPAQAARDAAVRIRESLAPTSSAKPGRKSAHGPRQITVQYHNHRYKATRQKSGQYRVRVKGNDIYCGTVPELVKETFAEKIVQFFDPNHATDDHQTIPSLDEAIEAWLEAKRAKRQASTCYAYETKARFWRQLAKWWLNKPLDHVTERQWLDLRKAMQEVHGAVTLQDDVLYLRGLLRKVERKHGILFTEAEEALEAVPRRERLAARRERQRFFEPEEIRKLYAKGKKKPVWKLLILMGLNGAMEPGDLAKLRWAKLDREKGWFDGIRQKTSAARRFPYWPDTLVAIQEHYERVEPADENELVFTTARGNAWSFENRSFSHEFKKLQKEAGVHVKGRGFYGLRHSFATFASKCQGKEQFAIDMVMGHSPKPNDMSAVYRGEVDDPQLELVCEFVRKWVFESEEAAREFNRKWLIGDVKPRLSVLFDGDAA